MVGTVIRARWDIARMLEESPSLRPEVDAIARDEMATARRLVRLALREHGEERISDPESLGYSGDQLIGDWLPTTD